MHANVSGSPLDMPQARAAARSTFQPVGRPRTPEAPSQKRLRTCMCHSARPQGTNVNTHVDIKMVDACSDRQRHPAFKDSKCCCRSVALCRNPNSPSPSPAPPFCPPPLFPRQQPAAHSHCYQTTTTTTTTRPRSPRAARAWAAAPRSLRAPRPSRPPAPAAARAPTGRP